MKHLKFGLYGEPGVGKSVFANDAPNRLFITTDGNYEFLEEFGAKPEDHIQVHSWGEAKKVINDIVSGKYDKYDTFVVDLLEDLFKWCEYEYCKKNGYEHVSDVGFAKGYDITRNEFFIEIGRLLSLEKNVILLMHGITYTTKDRRGIEHTRYAPSNRLPDKVLDQIEGRLRMLLRCYLKAEEIDGKLIKKRYLSLIPKENEFGIIRGVNENSVPSDIPLDFKVFAETVGLEISGSTKADKVEAPSKKAVKETKKITDINLDKASEMKAAAEPVKAEVKAEEPKEEKAVEAPQKEVVKPEVVEAKPVETKPAEEPKVQSTMSANKNAQLAALLAKLGK